MEEPIFGSTKSMKVIRVNGPDYDPAQLTIQNVLGFDLQTLLIVETEPLVAPIAIGTNNLFILKFSTLLGFIYALRMTWNSNTKKTWKTFLGVLNCWSILNFAVNKNFSSEISIYVSYFICIEYDITWRRQKCIFYQKRSLQFISMFRQKLFKR